MILDVNELAEGMPGLDPCLGEVLAKAASLCLGHNDHQPPTRLAYVEKVSGFQSTEYYDLEFEAYGTLLKESFADESIEFGACGVALLICKNIEHKLVREKAWKGRGFDYWLQDEQDSESLFHGTRLEVSGILRDTKKRIRERVNEKVRRLAKYPHDSPYLVIVVEFSQPQAQVSRK